METDLGRLASDWCEDTPLPKYTAGESSSIVLDLDGFGVAFGEREVLRAVNLAVPAVGCTVLQGPSGTGKSTLLRTLAGFNNANPSLRTWGRAVYRSRPCTAMNSPALVMQNTRLLASDVLENLVCEMPSRWVLTRRMQIDKVSHLLLRYGQTHLLDCLFQKMIDRPLGDQRVIAILRLLQANPALLLVDDPTAGLQDAQADPVVQLLKQLSTERALLVVMNQLRQARALGGQLAVLVNGVIEECGESAHS
jgi:atypical dual specificity phosphatase